MMRQEFSKVHVMVSPDERNNIIDKINSGELTSECKSGKANEWWTNKHHPAKEIPTNIYLLGRGTILELHIEYINKYGNLEWDEFINYTRELIKQGIMIKMKRT